MENDNLKKKVQEHLSGLSFQPSGKVWPKVEEQLKKEKKRRRIIFFWLFGGMLLLGSGLLTYFNYSAKNKNIVSSSTVKNNQIENFPADTAYSSVDNKINPLQKSTENSSNGTFSADTLHSKNRHKNIAAQDAGTGILAHQSPKAFVTANKNNEEVLYPSKKKQVSNAGKTRMRFKPAVAGTAAEEVAPAVANANSASKQTVSKDDNTVIADPEMNKNTEEKKIASDTAVVAVNKQEAVLKKNTDTLDGKITEEGRQKKKKSPWKYSLVSHWGISNVGKEFLGKNSSRFPLVYASSSTGTGQINILNAASPFSKGFAFGVGVEAKKKINKRLSFITGIQYNYFSSGLLAGDQSDSSAANMRSGIAFFPGATQTYSNHFHFISIPAGLQARWFTKNSFSGDMNFGFNIMELISTNALIYDTAAKLYYDKKSVFNKTQLAFNAGLQLNYTLKNKLELSAGPQFTQGIIQVGKDYNYKGKYFKLWALQVKYLLDKKRK